MAYQQDEKTVYENIIAKKNTSSILSSNIDDDKYVGGLFSNIAVAISSTIAFFTGVFDAFLFDLGKYRDSGNVQNSYWYGYIATQYQHGDDLIQKDGVTKYAVNDDTKKIVKVSAIEKLGYINIVKAAKYDDDENLVKLDTSEVTGLGGFYAKIAAPNLYLQIRSVDGDILGLTAICAVDKTKINSSGQSVDNNTIYPVNDAIDSLLKEYNNANGFNDTLFESEIVEKVTDVDGVKGFTVTALTGTVYDSSVTRNFNTQSPSKDTPYAGYYDTANVSINITYVD